MRSIGRLRFTALLVPRFTISTLKQATPHGRVDAQVHVQIDSIHKKDTREGKPFWEVIVVDAEGRMTLRAWSDGPAFPLCEGLSGGVFLEIGGEFSAGGAFGLEAKAWTCRELSVEERDVLLAGPAGLREKQTRDFEFLQAQAAAVGDPRLRGLAQLFLADYGDRMRRAAAARANHHARRGGLVEHVAQMARLAVAVAGVFPNLNRDLLVTGVLFHDCGKLWENGLPPDGFSMPFDHCGELLGHITIGIELVNTLWRKLIAKEGKGWALLQPLSEDVRLHLLHLVASHHGELQFGSPVVPKTPEAWALHYIDNMDAKLEMMFAGYPGAKPLGARVFERVRPLPGNLIAPLAAHAPPPGDAALHPEKNGNGHQAPADHEVRATRRPDGAGLQGDHDGDKVGDLLSPLMSR